MGARNKSLDVLRAIAVFMTFGRHMEYPHKDMPLILNKALMAWFKTGWAGVSLFFVLSGYLVSSLMFNEFLNTGTIRFGRFYVRRGLKIYPAFYCLLAFSLSLAYAGAHWFHRDLVPPEKIQTNIILSEVFFLQNYLGYIWVHVWSLAVEEHFYISLGIIIFLILELYPRLVRGLAMKNRFTPVPWICAFVFLAALGLRYWFLKSAPRSTDERFTAGCYTHLRIDSLFYGVILAYFAKFRPERFLTWVKAHTLWLLIAGLLLISPALKWEEIHDFMFVPGLTLMSLGFGCLLMFTLFHAWKPVGAWLERSTDFLAYIGKNSYSVYLWHLPVMYLAALFLPSDGKYYFLLIAVQNIAGLVVGLVMAKLIEMPVLNIRDRFFAPTKALSAGVPLDAPDRQKAAPPALAIAEAPAAE
jgi:peptidoglycan/LPS O-acetylase OafA/YrhL